MPSGRSPSARSASSTATSAPALFTPSAKRCLPPAASRAWSPPQAIYGVLSLIFWSLIFVVTLKYVLILLRADNNGEGGTLALTALGLPRARTAHAFRARARHRRRLDVLWLDLDHAGAVGAVGGRGSDRRHPRVPALRVAADGRHPRGAVLGAVARHGARLGLLRADHLRLVPRHRHRRRPRDRGQSERARRDQPGLRHRLPVQSRDHRAAHARLGVPRRHRVRGALQRPRPFRQTADPGRLALLRAAGAAAQLFRPRRAAARASRDDRKSVLSALSRLGALSDGHAGHRGHGDRQPGGHHRGLFHHPPGDAARLHAAHGGAPHLRSACRPDLHAARELAAADRRAAAGLHVPVVERARCGLCACRRHHRVGRRRSRLHRDLEALEVAALGCPRLDGPACS